MPRRKDITPGDIITTRWGERVEVGRIFDNGDIEVYTERTFKNTKGQLCNVLRLKERKVWDIAGD